MTDILKEHIKEGSLFERLQMKGFSLRDIYWFMEQYDLNRLALTQFMVDERTKNLEQAHIHLNYIRHKNYEYN